jgi:hypothetical protein
MSAEFFSAFPDDAHPPSLGYGVTKWSAYRFFRIGIISVWIG